MHTTATILLGVVTLLSLACSSGSSSVGDSSAVSDATMLDSADNTLVDAADLSFADRPALDDVGIADTRDLQSADSPDGEPDAPWQNDTVQPGGSGYQLWKESVQPLLIEKCQSCHLGTRFAFASLKRSGATFTETESQENYQTYLHMISLDNPQQSRLLVKPLNESDQRSLVHAGGDRFDANSLEYKTILAWIQKEKQERCPTCGTTSPVQYIAYLDQPRIHWAIDRETSRTDRGYRKGAQIMIQPVDADLKPSGAPIQFLPASFCGADGFCDFGHLSASYDGKRLVFECRLSFSESDWLKVRWNLCVAEIGADGKAKDPRFVMPASLRHKGSTVARSTPFGLTKNGVPVHGIYDLHWQIRNRQDQHPVFAPDDQHIYFSGRRIDPRSGDDGTRTYHGFEHVNHILIARILSSSELDDPDAVTKLDLRTIYLNEGGLADFPAVLKNGNLAFHVWNLERMDRHLYVQSTADGMMELPVLFGRMQGPNMWGKFTQLTNGAFLGMTGLRRGVIENYVPFLGDHTLGTGLATQLDSFVHLAPDLFDEIDPFPQSYCKNPPDGQNCTLSRFIEDPSWAPDGRALIAYNPEKTYISQGEELFSNYSTGDTVEQRLASLTAYLPAKMGLALIDKKGAITPLLAPVAGRMYRYPVWIGRRQSPRLQPWKTDEQKKTAELHIADFPLWLGLRETNGSNPNKQGIQQTLDRIVSVRVLSKALTGNAGLTDGRPYRYSVNGLHHDHPTHLGINNATGYVWMRVDQSDGGDPFGDIPLRSDKSIRLRLPAGKLLLFQGIDKDGHVVAQHSRVFALPPGHKVDTSVRRSQYRDQCSSCHGTIDQQPLVTLDNTDQLGTAFDFNTEASLLPPVDLTSPSVVPTKLTFLEVLRPILDAKCVSCHSGEDPGGELNLEAEYSPTGNYPKGKWVALTNSDYLNFVPQDKRVPSYRFSVSYSFMMREDQTSYKNDPDFSSKIANHVPLGALAPWDPGYQNLFANDGQRYVYLSDMPYIVHLGRGSRIGGNSQDSFLLEILSGRDMHPTKTFNGSDHTGYLSETELRLVMAVIDMGFPFMARCDDKLIPEGPNQGKPWCSPEVQ